MGELRRTAALLGFYGDDLDPEELSASLGGAPTVAVRKGGIWHTSRGAEKIASTGSWRVKADDSRPGDLDGQIRALLAPLTRDLAIWRDFSARFGGRIFAGAFLGSGNDWLRLEADTLAALAERGLYLDLDIYDAEARGE
jgi:hypothetical protein